MMRGIHKRFGPTIALAGVDLAVQAGEVHALIGENGAGKSTLMKILSGAHQPDGGTMQLDGNAYQPVSPSAGRAAGVAMIYQELSLAPHLTVQENITLGSEPCFGPFIHRRQARETATHALHRVGLSQDLRSVPLHRLSVAQRQLVEIARGVALGCRVLVLDEPTSSLSTSDTRLLFSLIREWRANGMAIVYISHVLEEVLDIADRYTVLRDGCTVGTGAMKTVTLDDIVSMMVGRHVDHLYARTSRKPGEVVLTVSQLGGNSLPIDASLELRRGEIVGIAGLIGAGRTELVRTIFGLDPVKQGTVQVAGRSGPFTPAVQWRNGVGMVSEDRKTEGLAVALSVADNMTLPRLTGMGPLGTVTRTRQAAATSKWAQRLSIRYESPFQPLLALSGGNQQKIALARLLHADVDVLLLDEPTRGIDVGSKAQIYHMIDELASGTGPDPRPPCAVLIVSSYLPELLGICDRIAVMRQGRLGRAVPVEQLDEHRIMTEAATAGQPATAVGEGAPT
ncbi:MAG: sugar ABC transporter ATP-binding protein [Planctomycetes bacterium]|nr:sugar ABC transporter ATP-binding protein [Planctomycetota bacterium]NOG54486.1 sugar ABC transporter ATP-binding protein [Planctomycetota bacterium]